MSYCINPKCQKRQNPDELENCQACGSSLTLNERYRLIKPLRELDGRHPTEIFEVDNCGTPKVLKVLTSNRRRLVELFQREAQVLQRLNYPGIPSIDTYFVFSPSNGSKELHCLVMEKIEGENLLHWLEKNGAISEELALDWLQQLTEILAQVHREQLLHRDIKPSNIMLRFDGQLVLIDFGAVREITRTYIRKIDDCDVTRIYSPGYTAPEQFDGQAVLQSELFALGRTFVHLVTGTYPDDLLKNQLTNQVIWRESAPQISTFLANLIDDLIAPLPQNRPRDTQVILERLAEYKHSAATERSLLNQQERRGANKRNSVTRITTLGDRALWLTKRSFSKVLLVSVITTSLAIGVRYLGIFQQLEMQAFDQMQRLKADEGQDPRILVVTVTEADIRAQEDRKGSLSDRSLAQLLKKLEQFKPRAIGLDIYRDVPLGSEYKDLATMLRQDRHFIGVCKSSDPEFDPDGVSPPPEIPPERLSFSDFVEDDDGILRRHILALTPDPASPCPASYSFSTLLAFHYLAAEGILPKFTPDKNLQLGNIVFKRLQEHTGSYQQVDARGNQVLLNYRSSRSPEKIAARVTLGEVLKNRINPNSVKDRLILIGVTAPSTGDYWSTPYGTGQLQKMPGILLQAQMVSQILSAVLDRRPLLWFWSFWGEALWIWGWSLVGGVFALTIRRFLNLTIAGVAAIGFLCGICFGLFLQGGWVPLVPSAIALLAAGGSVRTYAASQPKDSS